MNSPILIRTIVLLILFSNKMPVRADNVASYPIDSVKFPINVVIPGQNETLPGSSSALLQSRLSSVLASNGVSGESQVSSVTLFPVVNILNKEIAGSITRNYIIEIELLMFIGEGISGLKFNTLNLKLKGAGASLEKAYVNAFSSIRNSNKFGNFISSAQDKITQYYISNCSLYLNEAQRLFVQDMHLESIAVLSQILPHSGECHAETEMLVRKIYNSYRNVNCEAILMKAKSAWIAKDINKALSLLDEIHPESICTEEQQELHVLIKKEIDESELRKYREEKSLQKDQKEHKNRLINLAENLGVEALKVLGEFLNQRSISSFK